MARRRQLARETGLCSVCCRQKPNQGRTVCISCNSAKADHRKYQRQAKFQTLGNAKLIEAHERAGDVAHEHHFYAAAAQHYEDALRVPHADESAWIRLSEKLAEALWLGNEPGAASAINDRLLATYRSHPERSAEHVKTLFRVAQQLWIDSRTKHKIPILGKAIQIAELSNDVELLKRANIVMANTFAQLAHFEEADRYLRAVEELCQTHNLTTGRNYYTQKGGVAAGLGREEEAFANYNRVLEMPRSDDSYNDVILRPSYGRVALMFGRTQIAKANLEHGLLAARRNKITWLVPKHCLEYAEFLMCIGAYTSAHEYLLEALSSDARTPILDELIAYVGIPLALYMKDEKTLAKCVRLPVIDRAFLSGEPARVGFVSAAFARLYIEQGQSRKARALLHRAIDMMHNIDNAWPLTLEIARCGARIDFPKARGLLTARMGFPCAQVAEAHLQLFDAFVAQREGRYADVYTQARAAATRFEEFQWGRYAELSRSLLPVAERRPPASEMQYAKQFFDLHAKFTKREHEVAALVLKGLGNRAIADALLITENTIEKHVASVMKKLGIRSRYQLADALAHSDVEQYYGFRNMQQSGSSGTL